MNVPTIPTQNQKVSTTPNLIDQLIKLYEIRDQVEKQIAKLKDKFIKSTPQGSKFEHNNYIIEHAGIKTTITDEETLIKLGFDLNRVKVTITKIDPKLVKTIGEQEKKEYYTLEDRVIIRHKEAK